MQPNTEDADRFTYVDEEVVLDVQTLHRLISIRKEDDTWDTSITRLLDNAIQNVPIEEILRDLLNQFEDAVSINVVPTPQYERPLREIRNQLEDGVSISANPTPQYEDPGRLIISVHTGEVSFEENVSLYAGTESCAMIESNTGEEFCLPFDIIATCDGPKSETMSTTPVYATDSILGMEPISLDEGLDQLRTKIGMPRDELRELDSDH
ncbi:hypothetical protein [Halobaculum rarum]|uniref:hypothetical protein n=1 Tax=Halobaculum rarum TaxID=3075122 RepID=UPI0032AEBC29